MKSLLRFLLVIGVFVLSINVSNGDIELGGPTEVFIECDENIPNDGVIVIFNDCVDDPVPTYSDGPPILTGSCNLNYSFTRTWTATNQCGDEATFIQIINIRDETGPVITFMPPDVTISCDQSTLPANTGEASAFDACSFAFVSFTDDDIIPGPCSGSYTIVRFWKAQDLCGNQAASLPQFITVIDITLPTLVGVPADLVVQSPSEVPNPPQVTATDNCGTATVSFNEVVNVGGDVITRTWTATDECGNEDSRTQIIEVQDTTQPALVGVPADIIVQCSSEVPPPADVTGIDFCDVGPVIVVLDEDINWGENEFEYHLIRTWTATDACGNTATDSQTIYVEDITAPVLQGVPQNITVECDAVPDPSEVTVTDNCENGVFISFEETRIDGSCDNTYTLIRTWIARDAVGNNTTSSQEVIVIDTTPPELITASVIVLEADSDCSIELPSLEYEVTDNCSSWTVTQDPPPLTLLQGPGTFPVIITAIDECGNFSTSVVDVVVEAPELQVICRNITIQLDNSGTATILPEDIDGGSFGGCGNLTLTIDRSEFSCSDVGQNEVILTVTDSNQNSVSCMAFVTVEDNIAPVIQCLDITLQLDAAGNVNITPQDVLGLGSDACGIASISVDRTSFTCNDIGTNTITLTATDVNGNSSSCTAIVTVEDVVAPIAICQNITIELDASGNASITTADIDDGSNDACGLASLSIDNTSFTCADIGLNLVTLTVTDVNGNVSSCQATVTVVDAIAPIITSPENLTQGNDPGVCDAEVVLPDLIVDDNCEVASIENDSPNLFPVGSTTVKWTVSDIEGNISTVEQVVTIINEAPVINTLEGPASPLLTGTEIQISGTFTDNNLTSATVDWGDGQSSEALIVGNEISGSHNYSVPGTVNIILTVEDACGETAEAAIENLDIISESFEGFVKGAGFYNSPKGAYKSNPHASGRFLFGFLVKNRDHYDHPKGGTIFFLRAGRMLFASHDYEYLRVNEGEAIYQGTGRVNRGKNYQFQVTAIDGQASKTDEYNSDAIKIKIWNEDGVIYENDLTEIWRGHIWIYPFTKHLASARTVVSESYQEVDETTPTIEELISEYGESNIMAYPNPFDESVRIEYIPLTTGRASVKIYDLQGRIVATIFDGEVEEFLPLSWEFRPDEYLDKGVYMLRIQDGLLPQTIRLNYHK